MFEFLSIISPLIGLYLFLIFVFCPFSEVSETVTFEMSGRRLEQIITAEDNDEFAVKKKKWLAVQERLYGAAEQARLRGLAGDTMRIEEQAALLAFIETLAKHNQDSGMALYKSIQPLSLNADPASVANSIHHPVEGALFLALSNAEIALLHPRLRLFKTKVIPSAQRDPGDRVEIIFPGYRGLGASNTFLGPEAILEETGMRDFQAGIKSFSFDWEGANDGLYSARKILRVNLSMVFGSLETLLRNYCEEGASFSDLIARTGPGLDPCRHKRQRRSEEGLPTHFGAESMEQMAHIDAEERMIREKIDNNENNYYRIEAEVGWNVPREVKEQNLMSENIIQALERSSLHLSLELVRHRIDIRQEGSVQVDAEYIAAIEGSLVSNKYNILNPDFAKGTETEALLSGLNKELELIADEVEKLAKRASDGEEEGTYGEAEKVRKEELAAKAKRLKVQYQLARIPMYSALIEKINQKTYSVEMPKELVEGAHGIGSFMARDAGSRATAEAERAEARVNATKQGVPVRTYAQGAAGSENGADFRRVGDVEGARSEIVSQYKTLLEAQLVDIKDAEQQNTTGTRTAAALQNIRTTRTSTIERSANNRAMIKLNYFYMGDLIDAAASLAFENAKTHGAVGLIIGNLPKENMAAPWLSENPPVINLCDVPISLDLFSVWWMQRVIFQERETYALLEFIQDLVGEFFYSVATEQSQLINLIEPIEHDIFIDSVVTQQNLLQVPIWPPLAGRTQTSPARMEPGQINSYVPGRGQPRNSSPLYPYLLIQPTSWSTRSLKADENEDRLKGIFHLYLGRDSGLVKRVTWNRANIAYLPEMAIADQAVTTLSPEKYNATVTLLGNVLFRIGQLVYLNPSTIGFGSPKRKNEIASTFGVGGYYRIIKCKNIISAGKFETVIECIWQHDVYSIVGRQVGQTADGASDLPAGGATQEERAAMAAQEARLRKTNPAYWQGEIERLEEELTTTESIIYSSTHSADGRDGRQAPPSAAQTIERQRLFEQKKVLTAQLVHAEEEMERRKANYTDQSVGATNEGASAQQLYVARIGGGDAFDNLRAEGGSLSSVLGKLE